MQHSRSSRYRRCPGRASRALVLFLPRALGAALVDRFLPNLGQPDNIPLHVRRLLSCLRLLAQGYPQALWSVYSRPSHMLASLS